VTASAYSPRRVEDGRRASVPARRYTTLVTGDLVRAHRPARMMNMLPTRNERQAHPRQSPPLTRLAALPDVEAVLVGDGWPSSATAPRPERAGRPRSAASGALRRICRGFVEKDRRGHRFHGELHVARLKRERPEQPCRAPCGEAVRQGNSTWAMATSVRPGKGPRVDAGAAPAPR